MQALFSIITVTYNAQECIDATLQSVDAQSCRLYEHLIIDGASRDRTLDIIHSRPNDLRRVVSEPDNGIYDAMNRGLELAKGDYVLFLNAGDRLHSPHTLELIATAAFDNDYPGIIYGQTDIVDLQGRRLGDRHLTAPPELNLKSFASGMCVCHQSFLVLRRLTSTFNTKYRLSADYDWCIRCLQRSRRTFYLDETISDYLFEGASTRNRRRSLKERFSIMSHYYGFLPTVVRHIGFLPRFLRRRRAERKFLSE